MSKNTNEVCNKKIILKIIFKNKEYEIDIEKVIYVLERLTNRKIKTRNVDEIKEMMKSFGLHQDEHFLDNINELSI